MPVTTPERFASGLTYEQYMALAKTHVEARRQRYDAFTLSDDDRAFFQRLAPLELKVLALSADWCGDAARSDPIIARLAETGAFALRFFIRDENLDLMDQFLEYGRARAIPCFVFLDREYNYLFHWGSRPARIKKMREAAFMDGPPKGSAEYNQILLAVREQTRRMYDEGFPHETVGEIRARLEEALAARR